MMLCKGEKRSSIKIKWRVFATGARDQTCLNRSRYGENYRKDTHGPDKDRGSFLPLQFHDPRGEPERVIR